MKKWIWRSMEKNTWRNKFERRMEKKCYPYTDSTRGKFDSGPHNNGDHNKINLTESFWNFVNASSMRVVPFSRGFWLLDERNHQMLENHCSNSHLTKCLVIPSFSSCNSLLKKGSWNCVSKTTWTTTFFFHLIMVFDFSIEKRTKKIKLTNIRL